MMAQGKHTHTHTPPHTRLDSQQRGQVCIEAAGIIFFLFFFFTFNE